MNDFTKASPGITARLKGTASRGPGGGFYLVIDKDQPPGTEALVSDILTADPEGKVTLGKDAIDGQEFIPGKKYAFDAVPPPKLFRARNVSPIGTPGNIPSEPIATILKWFNMERGFGFLIMPDGKTEAFVHISAFKAAGYSDKAVREIACGGERILVDEFIRRTDGKLAVIRLHPIATSPGTSPERHNLPQSTQPEGATPT